MRRSIGCAAVVLLLVGCGSDSLLTGPDPSTNIIPTAVVERLVPDEWKTDPLDIDRATITADLLELHVSYGGGCELHTFAFVVSRDFAERLESGQGPAVETQALIAHDAHGDSCERLVRDTLVADLGTLKRAYQTDLQSAGGAIVMVFDPETHIRYEF